MEMGYMHAAHHENTLHESTATHHHHSHSKGSVHEHGHHLLQVEDLSIRFRMYENTGFGLRGFFNVKRQTVQTIDNLSISVHAGEIVAIVGASGSGKTLLADSILGLFEANAEVTGKIWFDGTLQDAEGLSKLRGREISFIPQSISALDPLIPVGRQVCFLPSDAAADEKRTCRNRAEKLFEHYGLGSEVAKRYPHELSGGMVRRVLLCCALMCSPKLLIADEPTPGLDLDLAVKAMDDFRRLADEGIGVMLITHDIDLALRVADRIAIFNDGTVVEETGVEAFKDGILATDFARRLRSAIPEYGFEC